MLIVLSGKTASGKDTIMSILLQKYPHLKKVVTTTTRKPRKSEVDGVNHHFITEEEFIKKINNGEFVEYVDYAGNLYGTEKKEFAHKGAVIWRIDPSAAGRVREIVKEKLVVIFITTSDEIILERLTKRGLPTDEIERRMSEDKKIWQQYKDKYDYVIENTPGYLDQTVEKVLKIIDLHGGV